MDHWFLILTPFIHLIVSPQLAIIEDHTRLAIDHILLWIDRPLACIYYIFNKDKLTKKLIPKKA